MKLTRKLFLVSTWAFFAMGCSHESIKLQAEKSEHPNLPVRSVANVNQIDSLVFTSKAYSLDRCLVRFWTIDEESDGAGYMERPFGMTCRQLENQLNSNHKKNGGAEGHFVAADSGEEFRINSQLANECLREQQNQIKQALDSAELKELKEAIQIFEDKSLTCRASSAFYGKENGCRRYGLIETHIIETNDDIGLATITKKSALRARLGVFSMTSRYVSNSKSQKAPYLLVNANLVKGKCMALTSEQIVSSVKRILNGLTLDTYLTKAIEVEERLGASLQTFCSVDGTVERIDPTAFGAQECL